PTEPLMPTLKNYERKSKPIRHFQNVLSQFEEWGINLLPNRLKNFFLPKRFLLRLTLVNIIVIVAFVMFSSWAIYDTACLLADGLFSLSGQIQHQFRATLFQYLWIFSISAVILGSLVHFYLTKKITQPIKELIEATKKMKQGEFSSP